MPDHEIDLDRALVALREPTVARPDPGVQAVAAAGRVRRRTQVILSAAAAVLLLLVGVGAALAVARRAGDGNGRVRMEGPTAVYGTDGPATTEQLDRAATIIQKRLQQSGVSDAEVTVEDGTVVVHGSAVRQPDRLAEVARTGAVSFRPVLEEGAPGSHPPSPADGWYANPTPDGAAALVRLGPGIDRDIVESARAAENNLGKWTVLPVLRPGPDGIDRFNNELAVQCFIKSATCPTGQLAIVVGDRVLTAPAIQARSFERDQIEISGSFTRDQAQDVADVLNLGDLPVTLRLR
jgi:preprotein translocase subunit SecD